ncbi:hypothetical protein PDJAM_G00087370, partial [Pangasius djambal]|nr:hypothetical protein [Pangasius djambal]
ILKYHYGGVLEELLSVIQIFETIEWGIAVKWVKGRFKRKLKEYTLLKSEQQLRERFKLTEDKDVACLPPGSNTGDLNDVRPTSVCPQVPRLSLSPVENGPTSREGASFSKTKIVLVEIHHEPNLVPHKLSSVQNNEPAQRDERR